MTIGIETIVKGSRYMIRYNKRCMIISAEDCTELLELLYGKRDEFKGKDDEQPASNPWQAAADHIHRDEPDWGTRE